MRGKLIRSGMMVLVSLVLAACTEVMIADRTVSINKAVEQANNRLLLLNAVRASHRYPLYFAKIQSVNASDPLQAGVSLQLPFGGDASNSFTLSPGLSGVKSGLSFTYLPLDQPDFIEAVNKQMSLSTFRRRLQQGFPTELVFLVFIREISLTPTQWQEIDAAYLKACRTQQAAGRSDSFCLDRDGTGNFHTGLRDEAAWPECRDRIERIWNAELRFVNTPDDIDPDNSERIKPCRFLAFQDLIRRVRIAGFGYETIETENFVTTSKLVIKRDGSTETRETSNREAGSILTLRLPAASKEPLARREDQLALQKNRGATNGSLVLRSPEDMIFYLGQIVRARTEFGFSPKVALGPKREGTDLFEVSLGADATAPVQVTFGGKTYHIPAGATQSMQTLSLVNQLVLLQQSDKELPGPRDVRIIN